MFAWVLRFGLFGLVIQQLSLMIIFLYYLRMAFDFFNISGSLFVETNTNSKKLDLLLKVYL